MNGTYIVLYILHLQNITNHIISEEIQQMQLLVERFVPLSSHFKILLVSISEKAFKFERTGFLSNLTYGIDHLTDHLLDSENHIYVLPRLFKKAQI